jgi:hypothetical protein
MVCGPDGRMRPDLNQMQTLDPVPPAGVFLTCPAPPYCPRAYPAGRPWEGACDQASGQVRAPTGLRRQLVNSDVPLLSQCRLVSRPLSEAVASSSPLQPRLSPLQRIECYRQKFRPSVRALLTPMDLGITPWPLADTKGGLSPTSMRAIRPVDRHAQGHLRAATRDRLRNKSPKWGVTPMPPLGVAGRR